MRCLTDSIRHAAPAVQQLLRAVEAATSLPALVLAAWQVARGRTVHRVEAVRTARAHRPTAWPPCPGGGRPLRRKGVATRQVPSLGGPSRWRRRVGRCPQGCAIPQSAPLDEAWGVQPQPRTSEAVQARGWALALLTPLATAARGLGWDRGGPVRPRAVGGGVQAAGQRALEPRDAPWQAVAQGARPPAAPLEATRAAAPWLRGADGVRVPWRPAGGHPRGNTAWHAIPVGVGARLGRPPTRTGTRVARRPQRRVGAVCGESAALQRRLGLEALRQGIRRAPQGVWRSDGAQGVWPLCAACFARQATGR